MTNQKEYNLDSLLKAIRKYHSGDLSVVEKAYRYAEEKHSGQMRKSGEP